MNVAETLSPLDLAAIQYARERWLAAIHADDVEGLVSPLAEDIVALPPNEAPHAGKDAERSWHQARIAGFTTRLALTRRDIVGDAIWACENLEYAIELTPRAGGAPIRSEGSCLWFWQRQPDGAWKISRAIWHDDRPVGGPSAAEDARAIHALAAKYGAAVNAGDLDALFSTLTDDIVFMPQDGAAVAGAAASRAWLKREYLDPFDTQLSFAFVELEVAGDLAFGRGPFEMTLQPRAGGNPIVLRGKFIDVFRRQADRSWKFARVMFSSDAPVSATA
jgi:ketosteroid isomerase-like protein